jgi:hypothetical protein
MHFVITPLVPRIEARRIVRGLALVPALASWVLLVSCGSSGGSSGGTSSAAGPPPSACATSAIPSTVILTVTGLMKCSCFNCTFVLTEQGEADGATGGAIWSSLPITGCPAQGAPAYFKFATDPFGIGIADEESRPDLGNSDFAPVMGGTCSPFELRGRGSTTGNINSFCQSNEDATMSWTLTN